MLRVGPPWVLVRVSGHAQVCLRQRLSVFWLKRHKHHNEIRHWHSPCGTACRIGLNSVKRWSCSCLGSSGVHLLAACASDSNAACVNALAKLSIDQSQQWRHPAPLAKLNEACVPRHRRFAAWCKLDNSGQKLLHRTKTNSVCQRRAS